MQFNEQVLTTLEVLKDAAENDFEKHRIEVLIQDLTAPPKVEIVDDTHQKFNGVVYRKNSSGHFDRNDSIHQAVYRYYCGEISEGYVIHHDDWNAANNDISNLILKTNSEHSSIHKPKGVPLPKMNLRKLLCPVCGKAFTAGAPYNRKFCSKECKIAYERERSIPKTCEYCGKSFLATRNNNERFCSKSCSAKYCHQNKISPRDKKCPVCNKIFHAKNSQQVCCSHSCANKLRAMKVSPVF